MSDLPNPHQRPFAASSSKPTSSLTAWVPFGFNACVETGSDYHDICGEPEFMERMEASSFDKAAEKGDRKSQWVFQGGMRVKTRLKRSLLVNCEDSIPR